MASMTQHIDLRRLKTFTQTTLPMDTALYHIILQQDDEIEVQVFLARMVDWLKLSSLQSKR